MIHCVCLSSKPCHTVLNCTLACPLNTSFLDLVAALVGGLHCWTGAHCRRLSTICCLCQNRQPIDCFTCTCGCAGTLTLTSCELDSRQVSQKSLSPGDLVVVCHVNRSTRRTRIWDRVALWQLLQNWARFPQNSNPKNQENQHLQLNLQGPVVQQASQRAH